MKLNGFVGDALTASVKIIPEQKYPFRITRTRAKDGKNIRFKLDEINTPQEKGYLLTIDNIKAEKGRYYDTIFLKPDNKELSELRVRIYGKINDKTPPQKPVQKNNTGQNNAPE